MSNFEPNGLPLVVILTRYASRFSVRAIGLTVDWSMLWVAAGLAIVAAVILAFVPQLRVRREVERAERIRRRNSHHQQHETKSEDFCGDANRSVIRAAGRRRDVGYDARRAAKNANRNGHAGRAGD
jgi:uncharacterized membrane protein YhiD involved in acid resistance